MGRETAVFVYESVQYEVDIDGPDRPEMLMARLPDKTLVRVDFPPYAIPVVTRVGDRGDESIREARRYVWIVNFPSFTRRYEVTLPQDFDSSLFPETLAKLPDGRHILLFTALEGVDMPLEHIVNPGDPLFAVAKAAGRIFKARLVG